MLGWLVSSRKSGFLANQEAGSHLQGALNELRQRNLWLLRLLPNCRVRFSFQSHGFREDFFNTGLEFAVQFHDGLAISLR